MKHVDFALKALTKPTVFGVLLTSLILPFVGCTSRPSPEPAVASPPLAWSEEAIPFHGTLINLGFRSEVSAADRSVEPVATIARNGAPAPEAMVFMTLLASGGKASDDESVIHEKPALYEPPTRQTPALYSAGRLPWPEGAVTPAVRFRIVLPDAEEELTREIPVSQ